jgi:hypothetical protein
MKTFLTFTLLIACAGLTRGAIVETLSFDLSTIHPGSTLSGNFTLSNSPMAGDTAPVLLSFTDPADYSPTSLMTTISIISGTPSGFGVDFSPLTFTNLSGSVTPINTRDISLMRSVFANCASFPCTTGGLFQDRTPPVFTGTYRISPAAVPEPGFALLIPFLLIGLVLGRRLVRFV